MVNTSRKTKTAKQMERHFKGIANHHRIDILLLVAEQGGVDVDGIAKVLQCNFKTISEHTRRLVQAGLIDKKYKGRTVIHNLSPYGKTFITFIRTFQHSQECWNVRSAGCGAGFWEEKTMCGTAGCSGVGYRIRWYIQSP